MLKPALEYIASLSPPQLKLAPHHYKQEQFYCPLELLIYFFVLAPSL